MISFIVTTFNLEDWLLRRCLDSIVNQGFARDEYEIIVVDDESDISPQSVIDDYSFQANVVLYSQKHSRQGAARNLGLYNAKGDWVQFVDGDDYLLADSVVPALDVAETYNLDLLMFDFCEANDKQVVTRDDKQSSLLPRLIVTGNAFMHSNNIFGACWGLLFRRRLLDDSRFGPSLRFTEGIFIEDEEFVTRLIWRSERMAKIDWLVYVYYQRSSSTIHSQSREHIDELFRNYLIVLKRLLDFEQSVKDKPHEGVTRKIRFLTIDVFRRAFRQPDWKGRCDNLLVQLGSLGLYPIPHACYSWKYRFFRILIQFCVGRYMLRSIEKIGKK